MDDEPIRWMTYAEAAAALGVQPEAIQRRVQRGRWRRQMGNDGKARVAVPLEALPPVGATVAPKPSVAPDVAPHILEELAEARAEVEALRRKLLVAEAVMDGVRVMLTRHQAERLGRLRRRLTAAGAKRTVEVPQPMESIVDP